MISAKSRLVRSMGSIKRLRFDESDPSIPPPYFALYRNLDEQILISEEGVWLPKNGAPLLFCDMDSATCMVGDEFLLDGVLISLRTGQTTKIGISGHDGSAYDAHSFVRFLMRTLADRRK